MAANLEVDTGGDAGRSPGKTPKKTPKPTPQATPSRRSARLNPASPALDPDSGAESPKLGDVQPPTPRTTKTPAKTPGKRQKVTVDGDDDGDAELDKSVNEMPAPSRFKLGKTVKASIPSALKGSGRRAENSEDEDDESSSSDSGGGDDTSDSDGSEEDLGNEKSMDKEDKEGGDDEDTASEDESEAPESPPPKRKPKAKPEHQARVKATLKSSTTKKTKKTARDDDVVVLTKRGIDAILKKSQPRQRPVVQNDYALKVNSKTGVVTDEEKRKAIPWARLEDGRGCVTIWQVSQTGDRVDVKDSRPASKLTTANRKAAGHADSYGSLEEWLEDKKQMELGFKKGGILVYFKFNWVILYKNGRPRLGSVSYKFSKAGKSIEHTFEGPMHYVVALLGRYIKPKQFNTARDAYLKEVVSLDTSMLFDTRALCIGKECGRALSWYDSIPKSVHALAAASVEPVKPRRSKTSNAGRKTAIREEEQDSEETSEEESSNEEDSSSAEDSSAEETEVSSVRHRRRKRKTRSQSPSPESSDAPRSRKKATKTVKRKDYMTRSRRK